MINLGKIPPQAIDIEEAVLGALMLDSESYNKIAHIIDENSFYSDQTQTIFKAIKSLYDSGKPIDLLTVSKFIRDNGDIERVGGFSYITELTSKVGTTNHIEYHARIIQQKFIQRQLIKIGIELTNDSFDDSKDIEEVIESIKSKLIDIDNYSIGQNTGHSNEFVLTKALKEIEDDCQEQNAGRSPGINTGLCDLNYMTGGWRKSNLIILASRPGVGKTSLALHFALTAARSGKWVNFYGLEMSEADLMRIVISSESEVNRINIRDGKVTESDWSAINGSLSKFEKLPIIWNDYSGITANYIKSLTAKYKKLGKCDLVIVDYLQLVSSVDKKQNREQQVAEISRILKRTALSENIPIIGLAQLNREVNESTKPQLHHLRESGALEQDADVVLMPWIEENKYNLTIAKNRRGKVGTFEIGRNDEMTKFFDIGRQPIPHTIKPVDYSTAMQEEMPF